MRSEDIEIPEPCHADWDAMRPEAQGKFCLECRKTVHDLSSMTEPEAQEFLRRNACNDVCVSYEHDGRGNLHFRAPASPAPAPVVPLSRLRDLRNSRRSAPRVAAGMAAATVVAALAACTPHGDGPPRAHVEEAAVFQSQTVVIPHVPTSELEPEPVGFVDEPCDPQGPAAVEPDVRNVRMGKIKRPRLAGRPAVRVKGEVAAIDL